MKALKIMLFLLLLNVSFWALAEMGIWPVEGPAGMDPTNMNESINSLAVAQQTGIPESALEILGHVFTIEGFLLLIGTAAAAGLFTNANIVKAGGIVAFIMIFLFFYFNSLNILATIQLPGWLVAIFSGFHFIILMVSVIQLATGVSFKNMW